ncbi:MAG: hypothetical protein ABFE13_10965 [Phycisphaerales bacterium]
MTEKDKAFLEKLRQLMDSRDLRVELRPGNPSAMVLKGTYGQKIHEVFSTTRQGVRWRFQHLFGYAYVQAFETIIFIETAFGTELRDHAIRISRERYALRQRVRQADIRSTRDTRESP